MLEYFKVLWEMSCCVDINLNVAETVIKGLGFPEISLMHTKVDGCICFE